MYITLVQLFSKARQLLNSMKLIPLHLKHTAEYSTFREKSSLGQPLLPLQMVPVLWPRNLGSSVLVLHLVYSKQTGCLESTHFC